MIGEEQNIVPENHEVQPVRKTNKLSKPIHDLLGGDYLSKGYVIRNLKFLVYVAILGLIYIGNTYYAEKTFKDIEKTKMELKELRFQYITAKAQLMFNGRYSEVVKRSIPYGLKENTIPPYKIFYSRKILDNIKDSAAEVQ